MRVKTTKKFDEAGKVHTREAHCPYCGQLNWLVEELRYPYLCSFCEHFQYSNSIDGTFVFRKTKGG